MTILLDKLMLFTGCTLLLFFRTPEPGLLQVLSFLITIIFSCTMSCCNPELLPLCQLPGLSRLGCMGLWILFALCNLFLPPLNFFLPFLFYELTVFLPSRQEKTPPGDNSVSLEPYVLIPAFLLLFLTFRHFHGCYPWLVSVLCGLALFLSRKTRHLLRLEEEFRLLRDTSTEYHLLLKQKNRDLIEKQDYEIHVATLKERNRIAREIHDNVGHMLSRSILQSGALIAINQQDTLKEPLDSLKDTLSTAMDSIRESVHDLHDDSIDLKSSIGELLSDFSGYQVHFEYDMGMVVPAPVKYCFISITKEALSNIARHSNATAISITLREHPVLYQLTICDNGTADSRNSPSSPGIGLTNMKERVNNLNGHFSAAWEHGFRIFVSIPTMKGVHE